MALFRPACVAAILLSVVSGAHAQSADTAAPSQPSAPLNTMPRWSEFPGAPEAVPTPAEIRLRVNAQLAKRQELDQAVTALVWDKQEPDAIAAEAKSHIDPAYLQPVDAAMTPQQIDAFAAALRAKAVPPPVAQ